MDYVLTLTYIGRCQKKARVHFSTPNGFTQLVEIAPETPTLIHPGVYLTMGHITHWDARFEFEAQGVEIVPQELALSLRARQQREIFRRVESGIRSRIEATKQWWHDVREAVKELRIQ